MLKPFIAMARTLVPRTTRHAARDVLHRVQIHLDRILKRTVPLEPPPELVDGIGGSWWIGEKYVHYCRELCGMTHDATILDVGCGVGRIAIPLARVLSRESRYEGFDIMRSNIRWCQRAITPRWPHFRFQHADIYNREYNPAGAERGCDYRFPYADATFDYAVVTSVFTHLLPDDAAHYLKEISRVLKPGGRALTTFNLLNAEAEQLINSGYSTHVLQPREGVMRVHSHEVPEACVVLDEQFVADAITAAGLVPERILYGTWCGRKPGFEFQDIVIIHKPK